MAGVRLELTTFRVWTGCSSQLSYPAELNKIMVGMTGFEPATPWSQIKCTTKLCYIPTFKKNKMARLAGVEPTTFWSVVKRSIQLSYRRIFQCNTKQFLNKYTMVGMVGLEPTRCYHQRILSPLRLPIPPHPHWRFLSDLNRRSQSCSLLPYHLAKEPLKRCLFIITKPY